MSLLTLLPSPTCGYSSCGVWSSSFGARRKKDSMTTLTLLQSSPSALELRKSPPSYFFHSFSSAPQEQNSRNSQSCLLASHSAIRCLQQSSLCLKCRSPRGRGDRLWHQGVVNGRCGSYHGIASSAAEEGGGGTTDSQMIVLETGSRISSLDLLPGSGGLITRHCRPISSANEVPGSSEDESWLSTEKTFSSNVITEAFQIMNLGLFENNQQAMLKLALITSVLGLQGCSEAWGAVGTEVAKINAPSGIFDLGDFSDIQSGIASAFLLIFFSEIGDKTFFIAALLATRKSSVAVFSGTFGALMAMTVISVCLGRAFHYVDGILPSFGLQTKLPVDDIAAVILLVAFGVSTLLDAYYMDETREEQQEAELAIADVGAGRAVAGTVAATFALVFVAEWGDKSFFSTIALAAASSPLGVVTGAIAGHGAASLLAVLGGSFLGNYVSKRIIAYVGGVLFLVFAGVTLAEILN